MLLKTPTAKLPEAPRTQQTKTTQPATPVPEAAVTIPPLASPQGASGSFGIPTPPPTVRGIHFADQEKSGLSIIGKDILNFSVQSAFFCRYVYSLLVVQPSDPTSYYVLGNIKFWRGDSPLGEWPLADAVSPAAGVLPRSLATFWSGGGNIIDSSIILFLKNPTGTELPQYTLQPQYLECEVDRITVSIDEVRNVTSFRLYAGCKSVSKLFGTALGY